MDKQDLFRSFQGVDEVLLQRSENIAPAGKPIWVKLVAAAASMCLMITGVVFLFPGKDSGPQVNQYTDPAPQYTAEETQPTESTGGEVQPLEPSNQLIFGSLEEFKALKDAMEMNDAAIQEFLDAKDYSMNGLTEKGHVMALWDAVKKLPILVNDKGGTWEAEPLVHMNLNMEEERLFLEYRRGEEFMMSYTLYFGDNIEILDYENIPEGVSAEVWLDSPYLDNVSWIQAPSEVSPLYIYSCEICGIPAYIRVKAPGLHDTQVEAYLEDLQFQPLEIVLELCTTRK